jgi:hypothetical protein
VATTASPEAALAKAVAGYERSVTSPWLNVAGQLTDVAVVEAFVAAPSSVEVLRYRAPVWQPVQHIALPRGSVYLAPGHFMAESKAPPEWLRVFDLGPGRPGVVFYLTGASGWGGLVIGKPGARWEVVPFQGYGAQVKGTRISIRVLSWHSAPLPVNIGRWPSLSCTSGSAVS